MKHGDLIGFHIKTTGKSTIQRVGNGMVFKSFVATDLAHDLTCTICCGDCSATATGTLWLCQNSY